MATPEQNSSFTPGIKCSHCGEEVLLSSMGEHICSNMTGEPSIELPKIEPRLLPTAQTQSPDTAFVKPQRPLLPRIDPQAGNRPGMFLGELTPASSHSSSIASPRSASSGQRAPWRIPPRKISAPSIPRPPSPELANLDCAFPPFPTTTASRSKTPTREKSTKSSAGNEHLRWQAGTHNQSAASTPRSSTFGGSSTRPPRTMSVHSSRQRNASGTKTSGHSQPTSASGSRRPSFNGAPTTRKGSVGDTPPLPQSAVASPRIEEHQSTSPLPGHDTNLDTAAQHPELHTTVSAPSELESNQGRDERGLSADKPSEQPSHFTLPNESETKLPSADENTIKKQPSYRAKRPPPVDTGRSLPLLQRFKSILTPRSRAPTFPPPASDSPTMRRPSEPINNSSRSQPPLPNSEQEYTLMVQSPETLPQQRSMNVPDLLLRGSFNVAESEEKIPTGSHTKSDHSFTTHSSFAAEHITETAMTINDVPSITGAIIETPTETPVSVIGSIRPGSASSISSKYSDIIPAATDTVPNSGVSELGPGQTRRTFHTSTDSTSSKYSDTLSLQSTSSRSSLPAKDEANQSQSTITQNTDITKLEALETLPPLPTTGRPEIGSDPEHDNGDQIEEPKALGAEFPPLMPPRVYELQPDSPTDPLIQQGHLSPIPASIDRHNSNDSRKEGGLNSSSESSQHSSPSESKQSSAPDVPNKGTCRGCNSLILKAQKSVFSADGRLTGRYHKECFVCKTCKNPFKTADFYVLNDLPYCAQHYHESNGTICGSCSLGIEGQYMETSTVQGKPSKKFHTNCLACTTCRTPLREDYFEFNGRVYCEKDAFRLASLPSRTAYDSAPARPSPLVRELVNSSIGLGAGSQGDIERILGGRFPERRLTKLIDVTS